MYCYICVTIARTRDPEKLGLAAANPFAPPYPITDNDGKTIAMNPPTDALSELGVRSALTAVAGTPVCAEHMDHLQAPLSAYGAAQMQLSQMQPMFNAKES